MAEPVIWLELVKTAATVGAAVVAAIWAKKIGTAQKDIAAQQAYIASEQKRIALAKLNLELFEERYKVFYMIWDFLSKATNRDGPRPFVYGEFTNSIPRARFLFGERIQLYMHEIHSKRIAFDTVMSKVASQNNIPLPEDGKEIRELQEWFWLEASECYKRFAEYLDFSAWKAEKNDPISRALR